MKLIYCATPGRINEKKEEIMDFVEKKGNAPFHPFQAYPYERFEGGQPGRKRTMKFCKRSVDVCDELWLFGVSKGTLTELKHALDRGKTIRTFLEFDPRWKEKYEELKDQYGALLEGLK